MGAVLDNQVYDENRIQRRSGDINYRNERYG
jgi:hypothetical protein